MKKELPEERLRGALKQIQLRTQVLEGSSLTHEELARRAGVSTRSLGDWMRGVCAPTGMSAAFELLSKLDERDVSAILTYWRDWTAPALVSRAKRVKKNRTRQKKRVDVKTLVASARGK